MEQIYIPLLKVISFVGALGFLILSGTIGVTDFGTCGTEMDTKTGDLHFEMTKDIKPWVYYYAFVWFLISGGVFIFFKRFQRTS